MVCCGDMFVCWKERTTTACIHRGVLLVLYITSILYLYFVYMQAFGMVPDGKFSRKFYVSPGGIIPNITVKVQSCDGNDKTSYSSKIPFQSEDGLRLIYVVLGAACFHYGNNVLQ
jgi:hypothetical protein